MDDDNGQPVRELLLYELNKLNKKCIIDIIVSKCVSRDVTSEVVKKFFANLFENNENRGVGQNPVVDSVNPNNFEPENGKCATNILECENVLLKKLNMQMEKRLEDQELIIKLLTDGSTNSMNTVEKCAGKDTYADRMKQKPRSAVNKTSSDNESNTNTVSTENSKISCPGQERSMNSSVNTGNKGIENVDEKQQDGYKKVVHRRRKPVIGTNNNDKSGVKTTTKMGYLHLYRIDKDTTCDSVKDHLKHTAPHIPFECELLKNDERSASFKLEFPINYVNEVYNPEIWPMGAAVRRYWFRNRNFQLPQPQIQQK